MKKILLGSIALVALYAGSSAMAADIAPIYKAPPPVAVTESGFYVWMDGAYQNVHLPTYSLGYRNVGVEAGFPMFPVAGAVQSFDPHLDGGGVRGALGYRVPGTNLRLEVGGSYVKADGNTSQTSVNTAPDLALQLLNGVSSSALFRCVVDVSCSTRGTLSSSYDSWQFNGKAAYDWKYGSITLTPSAALFGGISRNNQSLAQTFTQTFVAGGAIAGGGQYAASTSLSWTDFGGRVGLDASVPLNNWFTVAAGGWVGLANRNASLSGNDNGSLTSLGNLLFSAPSAVTGGASTTAFLANAEAGFAIKARPGVTLRGFVGLNYDNKVPGVSTPVFVSSTVGIPAGIYFARETSYYAGGGLTVSLGGPIVAKY
jgi:hypothetical protein